MAGGERVLELLDTEPAVATGRALREMPPIAGGSSCEDVSFAYRADAPRCCTTST